MITRTLIPLGLASGVRPMFDRVVLFVTVVQDDNKIVHRKIPMSEECDFHF
ncbi:hypothetical protein LptCag_1291 [Leptospirillum ferriphilum]|uniref:Uncharacterized protein n=1 Tax=Leptospirillum ferriphilum TaxID=178606 RepID=A0A094X2X1_9BACT|nr:hypothetical protein LptCag_1291 [Leptospirillum ferriphilum]